MWLTRAEGVPLQDGWMDGRMDGGQTVMLTGWPRLLREKNEVERGGEEADKQRNRSWFHLCSAVPLCEGSFAVTDVFSPVGRLQLSAAGTPAVTDELHQPHCLTQSCCITRVSDSAVNLMRTCGAPPKELSQIFLNQFDRIHCICDW